MLKRKVFVMALLAVVFLFSALDVDGRALANREFKHKRRSAAADVAVVDASLRQASLASLVDQINALTAPLTGGRMIKPRKDKQAVDLSKLDQIAGSRVVFDPWLPPKS